MKDDVLIKKKKKERKGQRQSRDKKTVWEGQDLTPEKGDKGCEVSLCVSVCM